MSGRPFTESVVEDAALAWLEGLGYSILGGPDLAPDSPETERKDWAQVVLEGRLRDTLARLNPDVPVAALGEALRKLTRPDAASLVGINHALHRLLVNRVPVEVRRPDGSIGTELIRALSFDDPEANDFLAVNQFRVTESGHTRRPDIVLFVNGMPLAVIELKNAADENADVWKAFNQLQTYKLQIPSLFAHNVALVASDGVQARIGTLTAGREWFMPWRTIEGEELADDRLPQLQVMLEGVFEKRRFLDLIRHFIVFEGDGRGEPVKKMAGYHQFHAVNRAVEATVKAADVTGDKRAGVVWHTQGSGKSLTMVFYAGRVVLHQAMKNPTLVVLTDRNDLDDQLFGTFARCHELLRQQPVQAQNRAQLRDLLTTDTGGVIFTTIQKFIPEARGEEHPRLSDRRNIVVIADEAHRSQYEFGSHLVQRKDGAAYISHGFAKNMRDALPYASFIGFTGTPIELTDANTRAVFGDYVSVYDIERAVNDGATVPIYYESRLVKLSIDEAKRPTLDDDFEEATEGEETARKERLKTKWAALEALVGAEDRIKTVAADFVAHFEDRLRALDGKAMIVCMSRRIAVALHDALVALRPDWYDPDDARGTLKVVMTGSASDPARWQEHIRTKVGREALAKRFKDAADSFRVVIVRDMWLTGFDAPCLHTLYADKPMRGHGLMQAIARVNRVFRDKPGGLIVDYLGLADQLRKAVSTYTDSGGMGDAAKNQADAVALLLERYEICCGLFHGFAWSTWTRGTPQERLALLAAAREHILKQQDGKSRLSQVVVELSKAFALSVPHPDALAIQEDVGFFQAVNAVSTKSLGPGERSAHDMEHAIRQLVSKAVATDGVIDIFAAAGLKKPDISILSDEFLAEVEGMPHRNLAVELLEKLLKGQIKARSKRNVVQGRSFAEMLDQSIKRYQSRGIETAKVIEELIALAKELREADRRGEQLGLNEDELAFYDALEVNDSAVKVLGDESLRAIARELVDAVRRNVTIDWNLRENARAKIRSTIKRILRVHGYPPDKQERATALVLEQAEALCAESLA